MGIDKSPELVSKSIRKEIRKFHRKRKWTEFVKFLKKMVGIKEKINWIPIPPETINCRCFTDFHEFGTKEYREKNRESMETTRKIIRDFEELIESHEKRKIIKFPKKL